MEKIQSNLCKKGDTYFEENRHRTEGIVHLPRCPDMAGNIEEGDGKMTLSALIQHLSPSRLWLVRWVVKLVGAEMKVWKSRKRKEKAG